MSDFFEKEHHLKFLFVFIVGIAKADGVDIRHVMDCPRNELFRRRRHSIAQRLTAVRKQIEQAGLACKGCERAF